MSRGDVKCIGVALEGASSVSSWMRARWPVTVAEDHMRAATDADGPVQGAAAQDAAGCEGSHPGKLPTSS
jgi:hypothetical protein